MPKFSVGKINIDEINSGNRYQNGDGLQAETINQVVEASAYAQNVAEEAKLLAEAASGIDMETFRGYLAPLYKVMVFAKETNPAAIYGGYWLKVEDAFLWCSGSTTAITYTKNGVSTTEYLSVGSRGGEMKHQLTVNEMPSHHHPYNGWAYGIAAGGGAYGLARSDNPYSDPDNFAYDGNFGVEYMGGGQAHNIMPKYFAVDAWYRVTEEEYNNASV